MTNFQSVNYSELVFSRSTKHIFTTSQTGKLVSSIGKPVSPIGKPDSPIGKPVSQIRKPVGPMGRTANMFVFKLSGDLEVKKSGFYKHGESQKYIGN